MIGLTTYLQPAQSGVWDVQASFLPAQYLDGVTRSGGIALLLPPQGAGQTVVDAVLDRVDGLVLTGGIDVDPLRYGATPHPATDPPQPVRDEWEIALAFGAIERQLPVLGICRGAQVLNVALGGSLHQHVPELVGHESHRFGQAIFTANHVTTEAGSRLASIVGATVPGQCYHHQSVDRLGRGVVVSARDAEGIVEGIEVPHHRFAVGVQWHPEESLDDLRLFAALIGAARSREVPA